MVKHKMGSLIAVAPETIQVSLEAVSKNFSKVDTPAVDNVILDVHKGEAITLLGPSGCGKSTTLRMIAGLESPDRGRIHIGGKLATDIAMGVNTPPNKRDIGMVFQSYAIWPHMSVGENVAFPLKVRGVPKQEISQRVANALSTVGLNGLTDRPATQLSGGQQQRVALARAIVHQPKVLLLDEPLSNLDVKLREQMQVELKTMHRNLGWTIINVTHDQAEAMGVSDRIAVMDHGRIVQIGTPRELYDSPATRFVRDFIGKSVTLRAEIVASSARSTALRLACDPQTVFELNAGQMPLCPSGASAEVSIRPENIHIEPVQAHTHTLTGLVTAVLYQGERDLYEVSVAQERILLFLAGRNRRALGQSVTLYLETDYMRVWTQ